MTFIRPFAPELIGWIRDFGQGASNYDANGHYARIQPIFNAFSFASNPAGGVLTPVAAERPLQLQPERPAQALPGRREPAARGQVGAVPGRRPSGRRLQPAAGAARSMRRVAAITLVLAAAAGLTIFGTAAGDSSGYQVRAIFDDANYIISGEDVKIAGVKVGSVDSLDVTKDKKAAIVLNITSGGFQDFRTDAHCTIRPQSLIGENFVECSPTAPHAPGAQLPPKLRVIKSGAGQGPALPPGQEHVEPGRHRPDQQHPASTRAGAPVADHRRARHRPGRQRQGARGDHPPREPGAAGDRQGPEHPRQPEQGARRPRGQLRHRPRPAGGPAPARRRLRRQGQHGQPGHGRAQRRAAGEPPAPAPVPDRAAPDPGARQRAVGRDGAAAPATCTRRRRPSTSSSSSWARSRPHRGPRSAASASPRRQASPRPRRSTRSSTSSASSRARPSRSPPT